MSETLNGVDQLVGQVRGLPELQGSLPLLSGQLGDATLTVLVALLRGQCRQLLDRLGIQVV